MTKTVSVVLIGINGYGNVYLNELLDKNKNTHIAGVVDIHPEKSDKYQQLLKRDIPVYKSLESFYEKSKADLAVISTPIHLHTPQAILAMQNGSHVLCEKPLSGNPKDIRRLKEVRDQTGKFLAVGFNWSFTSPVQELKRDILNGLFGKAIRFKSLVLWPRNKEYYNRSGWAGKKYSKEGDMIFDSVANNATAHFLHHLLYLAGSEIDRSAEIREVTAELYRLNQIETFDTCAARAFTADGVEVLYYASHAIKEEKAPRFILEFEKAVLSYQPAGDTGEAVIAEFQDGTTKKYPELNHGSLAKLDICIEAIQNKNQEILCGIEAASSHVYMIQAMHQSVPEIPFFPLKSVQYEEKENLYWMEDLEDILENCYKNSILPAEAGVSWSKPGMPVKV